MSKIIKDTIPYFDTHQDISDSILYSAGRDFLKKNKINEGENEFGLPVSNQSDFYRLQKTGGKAIFAVSCVVGFDKNNNLTPHPNHFQELLRHLNLYHDIVRRSKGKVELIKAKRDLQKWNESGKIKFLLSVEDADSIIDREKLEAIYNLGVRCASLTYNEKNNLGGGANTKAGLTKTGKGIVMLMEELGMLLDLSHIGTKSFYDVMEIVKKPPIVSHTACKALTDHPRNMTDDQLLATAKKGGMIGICGIPRFVGGHSITNLVAHYLHLIDVVGIDHVILGSDLGSILERPLIDGFDDVLGIPRLFNALEESGLNKEEIRKIAHENILKLLEKTLI